MSATPENAPAPTAMWIIPHTHWDREWYEPHDVFRARLVRMIDGLLDLLEREGAYRFTLDGQAAAFEDYLAIRPHNRERLRAAVDRGQLAIGPFLSELDARQLTIDHDQLVMFGVKSDLKSLEAAVELLVRIQAAIASSPAVSHEYESAPLHVSFTDHPDWQYTDCDNSLLSRLPLEQGGYDHEVVNIVQSLGGPITFIRVTHNWKTRNAKNEWSSTREHTEHFCTFGIGFKFIPVSVNMGRGRAQKFESIEFNERFKVRCPSARFASDVFHQRQIEHLLRTSPVGFAITPEGNIQVTDGEWLPEQIGAMLVFFQEFFGWIPDFVWQELGAWPRPVPKRRG